MTRHSHLHFGLKHACFFFLCVLSLCMAETCRAAVTENFDSYTDGAYEGLDTYGYWSATNTMIDTTGKQRGSTGKCLVFDDDAGAWLVYDGADGQGKDGGLGVVSIWYRHWNGDGNSVAFQVEYSQNGGGWTSLGAAVNVTSTNYTEFSSNANVGGDNIRVRVRSTAYAERLCLDDITLGDNSGPAEDPNLSAAASLNFGQLTPGAVATQYFALANSGASNTLYLTAFRAFSGDTNRFSVGSLPGSLAPGANSGVNVIYSPGATTGASHSAVFHLISNDPSTPTQAVSFAGQTAGASLIVSNIQYSASGGASPLAGSRVYVRGVAVYADPNGYALSDPAGGPWSGIYVSDLYHRPNTGEMVYLEGLVQESSDMTQLSSVSRYSIAGSGYAVPTTTIRGNQLATEAYEGVLVRITNVSVKNENYSGGTTYWQAGDSAGNFLVAARCPYRYIWVLNQTLSAVQGLVFQSSSTYFLSPRFDDDFIGRPVLEYALRGLVMTPSGPRTNWYVHVRDDDIVAVTSTAPVGVTNVVTTGGIIFPGLIDAHNHPAYNSFPTLMFNNFPYGHRDEWGESDTEYDAWKTARTTVRNHASVSDSSKDMITKYGECLELMAGCVAIQGQSNSDAEHTHPDVILYNVEQFPSRAWCDIFPWTSTAAERTNLLAKIEGGSVNASVIHLCEGTDTVARAQFATWRNWGMLDETTAIIHGAALNAADFAEMGAAGAKLIWSPMSNMKLYAGTANVRAAKLAGVLVGLSPDWTPSGCYNILEELGYAWQLNQTIFSNTFTAAEMCDMVSLNNAIALGISNRFGRVAAGFNAGLCVIEGDTSNPYMALINARPINVLLTIVDGTPRFGSPALMTALGVTGGESISIRGVSKTIKIAVDHPFLDYSATTFATLRSSLNTAHGTLASTGELDQDELRFLNLDLLESYGDDVAPFRADNPVSSGPGSGTYDLNSNLSLNFRYQDFWDNNTFITSLTHSIRIVPTRYSNFVVQTVATNIPNDPAHQTVNFTVGFQDMHTNYHFCFVTSDRQGNSRTSHLPSVTLKLTPHTGGDTDGDGIPNEWETAYFATFTGAVASANADGDPLNNLQEYIADTLPNNSNSWFSSMDVLSHALDGSGVIRFYSPTPTSTNRRYDVWWTTNLLAPNSWRPAGLNMPGAAGGGPVILTLTNHYPNSAYRVGVKLP